MKEFIKMFSKCQELISLWNSEIDVYLFCLMYENNTYMRNRQVLSLNDYNEWWKMNFKL